MAKTIAVWGSPNSGKTTFATKLARAIYDEYQSTVIVVYADMETPTLPVIFPNSKKEDLYSVGVPLSKTEITQENVISQIVTVKNKMNFGFLGFTDGENRYTYPEFDEAKVRELYSVLGTLADYIIIDCTSSLANKLSRVAVLQAGQAFPVVVYTHKLENNARKIMDISECVINAAGEREYRCLYNDQITKNTVEDGDFVIEGSFGKPNKMSDSLKQRLIQYGVPQTELNMFLKEDDTA